MSNNINIAPGSYLTIQDWMLELDITITELIIYAVIHSFSQDGSSTFKGSQSYLAKWAKCSRQQVNVLIKNLRDKKLIVVKEHYGLKKKFCEYYTIRSRNIFQTLADNKKKQKKLSRNENNVSENLTDMCQESRQYVSRNLTGMCRETRQNNNLNINLKKLADSSSEPEIGIKTVTRNSPEKNEGRLLSCISKKIEEMYGSISVFDSSFLSELESALSGRVGEGQVGQYLDYIQQRVMTKTPLSPRPLFRKLSTAEDVVGDFLALYPPPKPEKKKVCPVCGNEINAIYYCCPHCEFSFDKADDEVTVKEARTVYEMDAETRSQYDREIDEAYGEMHFQDFKNEKLLKEREARLLAVKLKFGVVENQEE